MKLKVQFFNGCCSVESTELIHCWLIRCSALIKWSSRKTALLLVVSSCWSITCFALFGGGEIFESSDCQTRQQWELNLHVFEKFSNILLNSKILSLFFFFLCGYESPPSGELRQLVKKLEYTMLINNNHALFHLWGKENLVKHQEVSKYYENDCLRNFVLLFMSLLRAPTAKNRHI